MYLPFLFTFIVFSIPISAFNISTFNISNITTNSSSLQSQYNSNNFQYKGVALGGWLVLEPYITPSLFLAFNQTNGNDSIPIDEYHYTKQLGPDEAARRLQIHWDTFYNELDFETIKSFGLNMVRIPIGYWAFKKLPNDPYVQGAQEYLDKALEWAKNNDLKVWIDLHGLPGSQNGFDNSGYRDIGFPGWFNTTENIELSYEVLHQIYVKYGTASMARNYKDTILGIEVVNEPYSPALSMEKILEFYETTYRDARATQVLNNTIVFHDAFKEIGFYNDFMSENTSNNGSNSTSNSNSNSSSPYYNILIDHHHYEVFGGAVSQNITTHIQNIKDYSESIKDELKHHPAVVGEWSAALTDCTPWLNGVGLGSRYEGLLPYLDFTRVGSCSQINNFKKWSKAQRKAYRKFIEIQLDQYTRNSNGWIFWCFKTETTIEWDFKRLVELGLMPQPLNNFTYILNGTDTDPKKSLASSLKFECYFIFLVVAMIFI